MLKNVLIAFLILIIGVLLIRQNVSTGKGLDIHKKYEEKQFVIENNENTILSRVFSYKGDNSSELGQVSFHYERINKNSELITDKEGKWLVFDSSNNIKKIEWYQKGHLFYKQYYVSEKGFSKFDTFYNDSFKIESMSSPKVTFETDANDSTVLNIEVYQPEYPTYLLTFGCNCILKKENEIRMQDKVILSVRKNYTGEDIIFNVGYQTWETKFERKDSFEVVY